MKKYLLVALLMILIIPSIASAAWWNPFSWGWVWPWNNKTVVVATTQQNILATSTPILEKVVYRIDKSKVLVTGKKTTSYSGPSLFTDNDGQVVTLSAILKNNAEVGIPSLKINKIVIYDGSNNIVATKKDYNKEVSIPYQGEFPFSLILTLDKSEKIVANNFNIEFEIPPFSINEKVVRLDISSQKIKSVEVSEPDGSGIIDYKFTYVVLLSNNNDKEVSNIRRISFLKSNGETLTKISDACCNQVSFEIKSEDNILSLDEKKYIEVLRPYEQKEYEFEISPMLYDKVIDVNSIELVSYFIGVVQ